MKQILFLLCLAISSNAFAHGEDKYGPNMGYIRMPGTFHTELVSQKDGSFLVYLLDLQNKNPSIKDSSVELELRNGDDKRTANCSAINDHFLCKGIEGKITRGEITVKAKRLGIQAKEAVYKLPLTLKKAEKSNSSMEGHDMKNM
ncbi:MAG: hypothetical protein K2Q18_08420 [Bdellovibrionales bacterium]|nr:hypothetical protein [Bdellovibrionales bacterium]